MEYETLSKDQRYFYNSASLSARYFDRVAYTAAFGIELPTKNAIVFLNRLHDADKSTYLKTFILNVIEIIGSTESVAGIKTAVAEKALKQSYPYDRPKLRKRLAELAREFPSLKSYLAIS